MEQLTEAQQDQLREVVKVAMVEGMRDILTDDRLMASVWAQAFTAIQTQAERHTGRFVWAGVKKVFNRTVLGAITLIVLVKLFGLEVAAKIFAMIKP